MTESGDKRSRLSRDTGAAHGHGFGSLSSSDESFPVTTKSL